MDDVADVEREEQRSLPEKVGDGGVGERRVWTVRHGEEGKRMYGVKSTPRISSASMQGELWLVLLESFESCLQKDREIGSKTASPFSAAVAIVSWKRMSTVLLARHY